MAAGIATIGYLIEHEATVYPQIDRVTRAIAEGVAELARAAGAAMTTNRVGSMFTWFFTPGPVTDWESASKSNTEVFGKFFRAMLDSGVYLPPSQYEAAFLGSTHTSEDVQQTVAAAKQAFAAAKG
jgi:glutamate-1-semialdehyde 2,1-aminomutase